MLKAVFFDPLFNALIFISQHIPSSDLGLAIIILTIAVKIVLIPFYHQSLVTQIRLKQIDPEVKKIKELNKGDKTEETKQLLKLYKDNKINPFTGFLLIVIQLPIVIALFYVFRDSSSIQGVNHFFLGFLDVTQRNYLAAIIVGLTQFVQIKLSLPPLPTNTSSNQPRSFKDDLAKSMHFQMKYFMPAIVAVVAAGLPSALSLYWITSNVFAIGYELLIRRQLIKKYNQPKTFL